MEAVKKLAEELHAENAEWLGRLKYFEDELAKLDTRLGEILSKNNSREVSAMIEHFQNQFIRQKEVIHGLKHHTRRDDQGIAMAENVPAQSSDGRMLPDHRYLRDNVETFERIYADLKSEFEHFIAKTLN